MTLEELKQLKCGDEIFIRAKYQKVFPSPEKVIKNTETMPKCGQCRKFRKGDKVRIVPFKGRGPLLFGSAIFGTEEVATVEADEDVECNVLVNGLSHRQTFHICHLELVTPVEELEPYTLEEESFYVDEEECGMLHIYYNYNGGRDKVRAFYENGPEAWNATKAAAEAECARLNEEHRKEQNNA